MLVLAQFLSQAEPPCTKRRSARRAFESANGQDSGRPGMVAVAIKAASLNHWTSGWRMEPSASASRVIAADGAGSSSQVEIPPGARAMRWSSSHPLLLECEWCRAGKT